MEIALSMNIYMKLFCGNSVHVCMYNAVPFFQFETAQQDYFLEVSDYHC
jgi:hypothetical protein